MSAVRSEVDRLETLLVQARRDLHAHPELSWQETRTTAVIADRLRSAGIEPRLLPGSGLIADVGAPEPQQRVALRADIDALPVPESSGLSFASATEGVAHACGHDVHTTAVLGAALALKQQESELVARGRAVRVLFQPAEEMVPGGAHHVIDHGGLDGVDQVLAVHCDPSVDVGQVGLVTGAITSACDRVHVTLTGKGGHTSRPHLTQDLTYALAKVVTEVPAALSRRLDPRSGAALVWGHVQAGHAANVVPATGEASGTLRILDVEVWERMGDLIERLVTDVVAPYGVTARTEHVRGVPPVVNSAAAVLTLRRAASAAFGADAVVPTRQSLGGEDFSWYLGRVPGAMARLGTRTPGGRTYELHQGDLVVDERAITAGAKLLASAALYHATVEDDSPLR
ncbi:amidohydrolase [Luteipulveratus sp. YIM 133132]|uniref:Amidohydrolase n=1 Tax=Luteipulveratus flavus TaxID=3031728 RepID=A0ABT6C2L9_9MICO|nr:MULTISPECIES: amidohydrolase [unclassified Luteipulveratus]MDE9367091.1 amidohydrolase [Luteipulveratus sp. YIM 133132]MDF8263077.1 amidohydrolase [Luteipulveratus sp. YIM 133296]